MNGVAHGITDANVQQLEARLKHLTEEKQRSDEALSDLKLMITINPAVIYRLDTEGYITFMSTEIQNLLGFTPGELLGEHISVIVADEDRDNLLPIAAVRTGARMTRGVEVRLKKKNQDSVHAAVNWVTINASGSYAGGFVGDGEESSRGKCRAQFLGTQGTILDISDCKRAELELREAHDKMESVFNNLDEMIFSVDTKQRKLLLVSRACERITGYSRQEFRDNAMLWFEMTHPADKADIEKTYADFYRGNPVEIEHRIIRKDGSVKWVETKIKPRLDAEGQLVYFDGFVSDITLRKETELALAESEKKYHAIFNNSLDAMFVAAADGTIRDMNPSGLKLFGYTIDEIRALGLEQLYVDKGEHAQFRQKMAQTGIVRDCTVKLKRKDSAELDCTLSAAAQQDHTGAVTGFYGAIHDITDLKILGGLLPICSHCKKIRDDQGYWSQVEIYISRNSRALFSHSICPECVGKYYPQIFDGSDATTEE